MASDEIVWQVINQQFCSYKLKTTKAQTFCRNEYNVTGLCGRQTCPLANSRYATVRTSPDTGAQYLFMKTAERSHMPSKLWERIRLPKNKEEALAEIESRLQYWPRFLREKCKLRLVKLRQVERNKMRIAKEDERLGERVVPRLAPKVRRREETRERKAENAAKVERSIERELMERLRSGVYGSEPLNVDEKIWKGVLRQMEKGGEAKGDVDYDEGVDEEELEEEVEFEKEGAVEYVSDVEEGESDDEQGLGDLEDWIEGNSEEEGSSEDEEETDTDASDDEETEKLGKTLAGIKRPAPPQNRKTPSSGPVRKSVKGPRREIEYEVENEPPTRQLVHN